ncbi:hypothetical protein DFQ26_001718 [Actinomortierella ambigua]|nr:hypothetical protein DFQ26_001718 [Actinomortierella ambigua]
MELAEIRLLVAKHLDHCQLKTCAQVCREWHRDFQPLIWRHFSVRPSRTEAASQYDGVRNNTHRIQNLHWCFMPQQPSTAPLLYNLLATECRSLVSLFMELNKRPLWDLCHDLLEQNKQTLQRITLTFMGSDWLPSRDQQLSDTLKSFTSLHHLEVNHVHFSISTLFDLLTNNPSLQSLEIWNSSAPHVVEVCDGNQLLPHFPPYPSSSVDVPMFGLRRLTISGWCDPALAALLTCCRSLERFSYCTMSEAAHEGVCQLIRDRHFPDLKSLGLEACNRQPSYLPKILSCFPPHHLTTIALWYPLATHVQGLVEHQHQSLENVNIDILHGQEGSIIELLSRCSRLQTLRFAVDVVGVEVRQAIARPWVCTKLKELEVSFVLDPDCDDAALLSLASEEKAAAGGPGRAEHEQAMVVLMTRLGHLKELRTVDFQLWDHFGYVADMIGSPEALPWSMANGFAHLGQWTCLRELTFDPTRDLPLDIPELQFMRQHWVSLKKLAPGKLASELTRRWLNEHWPELEMC